MVAEQVRELGLALPQILLEPVARSTAPAVALAAISIAQKEADALLLVMPADHSISDQGAFESAVTRAKDAAKANNLVTFGIVPSRADSAYGYIRRGAPIDGRPDIFSVTNFLEKPSESIAKQCLEAGDYLWNSGMFLFKANRYLEELARFESELLNNCFAAVEQGYQDDYFFHIADEPFAKCPTISIDNAVMERTERAVVVPANIGWNDIGSWEALWDVASKDQENNVQIGEVLQHETRNSYLRSEGPLLAAVGLENLVVVSTWDSVLVCQKDKTQNVKKIVDRLTSGDRTHNSYHPVVEKPWGSYESLACGAQFQVKRILVSPGGKLSLQLHNKRSEHWVIVSGTATVTCGDRKFSLEVNESIFIPQGVKHRLENPSSTPLHLIEVQYGDYLGEDDIVRFEDIYGRY